MAPTRITEDMTGSYCVQTSSGTVYLIDMDSQPRHIVRLAADRPPTNDYADLAASRLRKDGEEIPLLAIAELTVSKRGQLWLDVRRDGVWTFRDTTPVVSIIQLSDQS